MRDPQVTMAMGFNTKPWSDDLDDLGVPPWLRKPPYILRDLATAGWFLWGFKWINSACCRTSLVVLVPWTCGLSLEHAGCPKISHSSPKSPSIIIFPIAILCSSETKNRFKHTHTQMVWNAHWDHPTSLKCGTDSQDSQSYFVPEKTMSKGPSLGWSVKLYNIVFPSTLW